MTYKFRAPFHRKGEFDGICRECGENISGKVFEHMAEKHGYIREGAQVFLRKVCSYCDKPALYRVGGRGLCRDHKHCLDDKLQNRKDRLDRASAIVERDVIARDRAELKRKHLSEIKAGHK